MTADATLTRPSRTRSDYAELSQRVRTAGLLERRTGYYVAKFALTLGAFAGGWVVFALIGASWWQLLTAVVLGVLPPRSRSWGTTPATSRWPGRGR